MSNDPAIGGVRDFGFLSAAGGQPESQLAKGIGPDRAKKDFTDAGSWLLLWIRSSRGTI